MEQSRIPALYPVQPDLTKQKIESMLTILVNYGNILNWIIFAPSSKIWLEYKDGACWLLMMDVLVPTEGSWTEKDDCLMTGIPCAVVANSFDCEAEAELRALQARVKEGTWFSLNLGDAKSSLAGRCAWIPKDGEPRLWKRWYWWCRLRTGTGCYGSSWRWMWFWQCILRKWDVFHSIAYHLTRTLVVPFLGGRKWEITAGHVPFCMPFCAFGICVLSRV